MLVTLRTKKARDLYQAWLTYYEQREGRAPNATERTHAFADASHHRPIPLHK